MLLILLCISQNELKAKWDVQKVMLEESKNCAEKKYIELNEQVFAIHYSLLLWLIIWLPCFVLVRIVFLLKVLKLLKGVTIVALV